MHCSSMDFHLNNNGCIKLNWKLLKLLPDKEFTFLCKPQQLLTAYQTLQWEEEYLVAIRMLHHKATKTAKEAPLTILGQNARKDTSAFWKANSVTGCHCLFPGARRERKTLSKRNCRCIVRGSLGQRRGGGGHSHFKDLIWFSSASVRSQPSFGCFW